MNSPTPEPELDTPEGPQGPPVSITPNSRRPFLKAIAKSILFRVVLSSVAGMVLLIAFSRILLSPAHSNLIFAVGALVASVILTSVGLAGWRKRKKQHLGEPQLKKNPGAQTETTTTPRSEQVKKWFLRNSGRRTLIILGLIALAFMLIPRWPWLQTVPRILIVFTIILIWMLSDAAWRKTALGIIAILAIVIFLIGGWSATQARFNPPPPVNVYRPNFSTSVNCDNSFGNKVDLNKLLGGTEVDDYHTDPKAAPTLIQEGCWGPILKLQDTWGTGWCSQFYPLEPPKPDSHEWIAFRLIQRNGNGDVINTVTRGPYYNTSRPQDDAYFEGLGHEFQLQGNSQRRFYGKPGRCS